MRNLLQIKRYMVILLFFISCKKEEVNNIPESSTIVYIEANNDLKVEARKTINDLENGASKNRSSNILVYIKDNEKTSHLLKILPDEDNFKIISDTLKTFMFNERTNAAQINEVLTYVNSLVKSDRQNLILWSHGTSWSPAPDYANQPKTKSFGYDRGEQIDIIDLKNALPIKYNLIIFDACSMSGIEVLYEFKNKANYIISSPTDILSEGFPYKEIVNELETGNESSFIKLAGKYYNFYNSKNGLYRSCSISLTRLNDLTPLSSYMSKVSKKSYMIDNVQRLDLTPNFPVKLYDFMDFIEKNFNEVEKNKFNELVNNAVIYKKSTEKFMGNDIKSYSGITISYPLKEDLLYSYYLSLSWNIDSKFLR